MPVPIPSREGVIPFQSDGDTFDSSAGTGARIFAVIVRDPGAGNLILRSGSDSTGPPFFVYNESAGATVPGTYYFNLEGCCTTAKGIYYDSVSNTPVDIYIK